MLSGLKQHILLCHSFHGLSVQIQVSWVLSSGPHKAEMSVMATVSSETWASSKLVSCWWNHFLAIVGLSPHFP